VRSKNKEKECKKKERCVAKIPSFEQSLFSFCHVQSDHRKHALEGNRVPENENVLQHKGV
jgi:hypothetical protein